jgi:hypothetical protein
MRLKLIESLITDKGLFLLVFIDWWQFLCLLLILRLHNSKYVVAPCFPPVHSIDREFKNIILFAVHRGLDMNLKNFISYGH